MKLLAVLVVALAVVPEAAAKVCASVALDPARPLVGQSAQVTLTTWMPTWSGTVATFAQFETMAAETQMAIRLTTPRAQLRTIPLARDETEPWKWRATMTFAARGVYRFWPDQRWTYAPVSCQPRLRVVVRAR